MSVFNRKQRRAAAAKTKSSMGSCIVCSGALGISWSEIRGENPETGEEYSMGRICKACGDKLDGMERIYDLVPDDKED